MLAQLVPAPILRLFAGPYVAGDSMARALDVAARLGAQGAWSTLDLLGEDVTEASQVERNVDAYLALIAALAEDERFPRGPGRPSISLKPSAFTTGDRGAAFVHIRRIAEAARRAELPLTIDMEDHRWTDATLDAAVALYQEGFDVGTVLQSRLNRTEADLARIPAGMRVRLVIGIYPEPESIATTDKREMKERLLGLAETLLARGVYVEFASHDEAYVERFARDVAARAPERAEVQLLLGVPRARLRRRLLGGEFGPKLPVRLYVPFAIGWDDATAYLRRRMAESPSMVWLVLRNLFSPGG